MSILITGMEMPEGALGAVPVIIFADGVVRHYFSHLKLGDAIPVPPHGRLGDLDKLVEKIDGIWDCNDMVFKPDDHCCNVPEDCKGCKWWQTKDCIQRMVENAPTIIEAEEGET